MKEYKEIFDEFMQKPKEELAALLTVDEMVKEHNREWQPMIPNVIETKPFRGMICRNWDDCTNPHMDCINCPLRGKPGNYTINGHGTFSNNTFKEGDGQFVGMDQYQFTC